VDDDLSQAEHVEVFAKSNAAVRIRHLLGRANQGNGRHRRGGLVSAIDHPACDVRRDAREFPYHRSQILPNVCTAIGSIDEPPQRIDLGNLGVLEPGAEIRQLELALGFVGKAYVGYKAPRDAKAMVSCAVFASLERQIRIVVFEDDDAARVFQMEHEEPTDETVIVAQANASLALRQ